MSFTVARERQVLDDIILVHISHVYNVKSTYIISLISCAGSWNLIV